MHMPCACYRWGMAVALQIKDVREEVRDAIAARAAAIGQSMQTYLREILEREFRAERNKHLFDNLATHRSLSLDPDDVVGIIRAGRESDRRDDT
jgi:antitoxin FitA